MLFASVALLLTDIRANVFNQWTTYNLQEESSTLWFLDHTSQQRQWVTVGCQILQLPREPLWHLKPIPMSKSGYTRLHK